MRRSLIVATLLFALPLFATEPNPTARQRELIQQLLKLSNANAAGMSAMDAMLAQLEKAETTENNAEETKELYTAFRARVARLDLDALIGEAQVRIYAKYFDEKELADLVAFYSTPTGRKSIEVMPHLLREGMQAGVDLVSPKIAEAMQQAREEHEKKRPWRRTMSDMRTVYTALEAYALDHDESYPTGDYAGLEEHLSDYISVFPATDIWGHPYAYVVSGDGKHFRLVSGGADGNFEWDSRRIASGEVTTRYRDRLEDDLIFQDGQFAQLPVQANARE